MKLEEDKIQTVTGAIYGRSAGIRKQPDAGDNAVCKRYYRNIKGNLGFRMPFLRNTLSGGGVITLRGRVVRKKTGDLVMEHPEIFYPSAKIRRETAYITDRSMV